MSRPGASVRELCARLEAWLAVHRGDYLATLDRGASAEALASLDDISPDGLGGLAQLLAWRNGNKPDEFEGLFHNFQLMSVDSILEARSTMNALLGGGELEPGSWSTRWVPFLDNGGGDYYVLDQAGSFDGIPGQIVWFLHDDPDRSVEFPSLEAMLETFVASVEAGMWHDVEGDFHPEDDDAWEAFVRARNPGYPRDVSDDDDE